MLLLFQVSERRCQIQGRTFNSCFGADCGNKQKAQLNSTGISVVRTQCTAGKQSRGVHAKKKTMQKAEAAGVGGGAGGGANHCSGGDSS